ncbi:MAG: VIT1/CCC1 transporter family protein, partial [Actinomycetes bacterium]
MTGVTGPEGGATPAAQEHAAAEVERIQHEHSDVTGGWLRPAVFGASDGLVSNFALIAGVTGGTDDSKVVLLAGLAGLAGGAFSMAAGEYISVRSQAEQALAEIELERAEIEARPRAEERELAQMYVAKGVEPDLARQVARQLSRDPATALDVHVREELGLDASDLPSAGLAAGSSFASFAVGALL